MQEMICLAVTFVIQAGREEAAMALFRHATPPTRAEPGNIMYVVHRSISDPRRFFLYEQYVDPAALDAHRASDHFARCIKNGIFNIMETRDAQLYRPIAAEGA